MPGSWLKKDMPYIALISAAEVRIAEAADPTPEMSVFTEQKDLEAVIKKIKKQPYVDRKNIFLFGTSMGGMVSAITAIKGKF